MNKSPRSAVAAPTMKKSDEEVEEYPDPISSAHSAANSQRPTSGGYRRMRRGGEN